MAGPQVGGGGGRPAGGRGGGRPAGGRGRWQARRWEGRGKTTYAHVRKYIGGDNLAWWVIRR